MVEDELVGLLVQLVNRPDAADARRRAADLLDTRGLTAEAASLVTTFINFTGHEEASSLPCLCTACLPAAPQTAKTPDGVVFSRAFVVAGTRALHFWLLDELATDRDEIKRAVGADLRAKLQRRSKH